MTDWYSSQFDKNWGRLRWKAGEGTICVFGEKEPDVLIEAISSTFPPESKIDVETCNDGDVIGIFAGIKVRWADDTFAHQVEKIGSPNIEDAYLRGIPLADLVRGR